MSDSPVFRDDAARAASKLSDPLVGSLVAERYAVERRLARGGMATVYVANDLRLGRRVAVKVMHPHLAEDEQFIARFDREARSAARISHPAVVSVTDQGMVDGRPFLVMDLVQGRTLRCLLRDEGALSLGQTLRFTEDVLHALRAAAREHVIHRDIKPENVLIPAEGPARVADFGLARAVSEAAMSMTSNMLGTVTYMAPEIATSDKPDARTDLYSLGIMVFEMLTGHVPWHGENPLHIAYAHVHSDVPAPSSEQPWIPREVDDFVAALTARAADERIASADEALALLGRLRAALSEEMLALRSDVPPAALAEATPENSATPSEEAPTDEAQRGEGQRGEGQRGEGQTSPTEKDSTEGGAVSDSGVGTFGSIDEASAASFAGSAGSVDGSDLAGSSEFGADTAGRNDTDQGRVGFSTPGPDGTSPRGDVAPHSVAGGAANGHDGASEAPTEILSPFLPVNVNETSVLPAAFSPPHPSHPTTVLPSTVMDPDGSHPTTVLPPRASAPLGVHSPDAGDSPWATASSGPTQPRAASSVDTTDAASDDSPSRPRRRWLLTLVLVLALLGVGAGGGYVWWNEYGPGSYLPMPVTDARAVDDVKRELAGLGLGVDIVEEFSDTIPAGQVISSTPKSAGSVHKNATVTLTVSKGVDLRTVPLLIGLDQEEATEKLAHVGLKVGTVTQDWDEDALEGEIIRQSTEADKQLRVDSPVDLVISKGREPMKVPNVVGMTQGDAVLLLADLVLSLEVTEAFSDTVPAGTIISQETPEGSTLHRGDDVKVTISKGPEMIAVPGVVGLGRNDAVAKLENAGFKVEVSNLVGGLFGLAHSTDPGEGSSAPKGSTVILYLV